MNSIFTEENLLAFTTAARFGSFSKAAAELGVTTSAISYTIKPKRAAVVKASRFSSVKMEFISQLPQSSVLNIF